MKNKKMNHAINMLCLFFLFSIKPAIVIITSLLFILSCHSPEAIEPEDILKENAIPIKNLSVLNDKIFKEISNYDIIMVGEMHGTNEPAAFALGLCRLIVEKGENVILGMEIPSSEMENFSDTMPLEQLKKLYFFEKENSFGMNGEAWLNLIDKCNQNERITIKFIDNRRYSTRDSSMYIDICEIRKTYPNSKIVTLTGNIHNWLKPYNKSLKLGGYLMKDTVNFTSDKIMSIDHLYTEGTMFNSMNGELKLRTIKGNNIFFNEAISAKMYLSKTIREERTQYTHFLYTEKVTHSEIIDPIR